ncbi:unnamed protein product [Adineta ricciae]|uniref:Peptidase C1A papain C-terminal domain-containing protein n=1 Tax=Adineta ricciae TaxID=249248 RepID=A0A814V373_ADIRI|nr:unnamed protein product [Adineta ricciae]
MNRFGRASTSLYSFEVLSLTFTRGPCPPHVNHAVLLTGWGTDAQTGVPFWRVKNSWGAGWGENGFARFERKPGENQCFIYHEVTRPTAI